MLCPCRIRAPQNTATAADAGMASTATTALSGVNATVTQIPLGQAIEVRLPAVWVYTHEHKRCKRVFAL